MDKNEREKKMLYEWGVKNNSEYQFQAIDETKDSYFMERKEDMSPYIMEYGFETLPELIEGLDILWRNDEVMEQIKKVIGIAALKNKPSKAVSRDLQTDEEKEAGDKK